MSKARRGPPKGSRNHAKDRQRSVVKTLRLYPEELAQYEAAASKLEMSFSDYLRQALAEKLTSPPKPPILPANDLEALKALRNELSIAIKSFGKPS